jgi:hypothetical protein
MTINEFPVWKTIKIGTSLKTADDFRNSLRQAGFEVTDWANDMLGREAFTTSDTEKDVDLVVVSVAELGFKDGADRADIYMRAWQLGLWLCPAEVGPQLRLQYTDQPKDEVLLVAMEPILDSCGHLTVFFVEEQGGSDLLLNARAGHATSFWWGRDCRWVFLRRK